MRTHGVCTAPGGFVVVALTDVVNTGGLVVVGLGVEVTGPFFVVVDFTLEAFFVVVVLTLLVVLTGAGLLVETGEGGSVEGGIRRH
jgi:hypothetical protein